MATDGQLFAMVWLSESLTGPEKAMLTVGFLRCDMSGEVRLSVSEWSKLAGISTKLGARMLSDLCESGSVVPVCTPGHGKKPVYRLDILRLAQYRVSGREESVRTNPGRHERHRMQLNRTEAAAALRAAKDRLTDVERMLEEVTLERTDPGRWLTLVRERDTLAEDVIPRLTAFVTLYDRQPQDGSRPGA